MWLLLLRAWYESAEPGAIRMSTIPDGQNPPYCCYLTTWIGRIPSHWLEFARMEKKHHASSTFFIQTKYVSDYNSSAFFFGAGFAILRALFAQGFSIGSHSIIHSRGFNHFNLGAGTETFATYRPHGSGFDTASGATVFGEVLVSKQLLDGELTGHRTTFFRAGHSACPSKPSRSASALRL